MSQWAIVKFPFPFLPAGKDGYIQGLLFIYHLGFMPSKQNTGFLLYSCLQWWTREENLPSNFSEIISCLSQQMPYAGSLLNLCQSLCRTRSLTFKECKYNISPLFISFVMIFKTWCLKWLYLKTRSYLNYCPTEKSTKWIRITSLLYKLGKAFIHSSSPSLSFLSCKLQLILSL